MNLVLGLGSTGISLARYLRKNKQPFLIMDSRKEPPGLQEVIKESLDNRLLLGSFDKSIVSEVERVLVSPGISYNNPVLEEARSQEKIVQTDIDIFLKENNSKVILVTGTNGKTTVVSMTEKLLQNIYGLNKVVSMGNIGKPVLDHLGEDYDIALIEISSFQLELSTDISSNIAVLLNIAQDHLDRHKSLEKYQKIKQKIFLNTEIGLIGDKALVPVQNKENHFLNFDDLYKNYEKSLFNLEQTKLPDYEISNVNASIAIYQSLKVVLGEINQNESYLSKKEYENCLEILKDFKRLPHRYEILGSKAGLTFINDSKATNISSTIRALESAKKEFGSNKVLLICGGDSKNQDIKEFLDAPKECLKRSFIIGKDSEYIQKTLSKITITEEVPSLEEAVKRALGTYIEGDVLLLSPGCASTDMFQNYKERGNLFKKLVNFS